MAIIAKSLYNFDKVKTMITQASIENLRQRIDIVEIISHFIEVKKQGSSFVSVCPFHNDKNPSMHINPTKGFYHCFACKAGGDAFKFVMDYEKLGFSEAVEKIASISNFTLSYSNEKKEVKKDLNHILPLLNAFYKQNLSSHKNVLDYLYKRALNDTDIKKFELGFAPSNQESLRLLKNENIDLNDALEVGAVKKDPVKGEIYASFINRITFPIYDHNNKLLAFGGRTLNGANMAKYVNSPQSLFFDKSRIFYALNLAKESIIKKKEIIICEGYMDAIAFHKAGLSNAVAVLGTALGENHLPLIKRFDARVILCFDNDEAGLKAAMRSAFLLSTNEIEGKVVLLKGGKDPADLLANHQEKLLFSLLEIGEEFGEFYIRMLLKEPLNSALAKQKALEEVQKYTFLLKELVANSYTALVAKLLGVDEQFVKLSKSSKAKIQNFSKPYEQKEKNNLSELELLNFIKNSTKARELFPLLSDVLCFKHRFLAEKILQGVGAEDIDIREFQMRSFREFGNFSEFFFGIIKINFAFLNHISISKPFLALKKQIFALLNQNMSQLKKNLNEEELCVFLEEKLIFLKEEKDYEELENLLKQLLKTFKSPIFSFSNLNSDQEPF